MKKYLIIGSLLVFALVICTFNVPRTLASTDVNSFDTGLVSLSFDDGLQGQYANAKPVLDSAGYKGTFYIISEDLIGATQFQPDEYTEFMNEANVQNLSDDGNEIGVHTRTHNCYGTDVTESICPGLTDPSVKLPYEIDGSRYDLLSMFAGINPFNNFAYPFGAYNAGVISKLQSAGIVGARTVDFINSQGQPTLNDKTTDPFKLAAAQVGPSTPITSTDAPLMDGDGNPRPEWGYVEKWIDDAASSHTWLILVFHDVEPDTAACGSDPDCITTAQFQEIISYLQSKDNSINVVPIDEGLSEMGYPSQATDTISPTIAITEAVGESVTVAATSSNGAAVTFTPVVSDNLDSGLQALCVNPNLLIEDKDPTTGEDSGLSFPAIVKSGDNFPIGSTAITCTAADQHGNLATSNFDIVVTDGPTITVTDGTELDIPYGSVYTDAGATATDVVDGDLTGAIQTSGSVDTSTLGDYTITYTVTNDAQVTSVATRLVHVVPAEITITADNQTKTYGEADPALTYQITSGNLIGTDAITGTLGRDPGDDAGSYAITQGNLALSSNYKLTFVAGKLIIAPADQIISFSQLIDKSTNSAPFDVSATTTSGLPVSFAITSGPATISGSTVTLTGAGHVQITASQAGNDNYNAASDVSQSFNVASVITGGGGGGGPAPSGQVLGTSISVHPNGTLILDGQTVYLMKDNQRYGFRDPIEFQSYGYNFSQVVPANSADLQLTFNQANIVKAMPGTLVLDASDNRTVYMIGTNYSKRGFVSALVFAGLGYSFNNLPKIDLTDYPSGDPIQTATEIHPDGALVLDHGTVWWILNGSRQGFESEAVFNTYGFSFGRTVAANSSDMALPEGSLVKFRDGTLVADSGIEYIISDGQARPFTNSDSLTSLGYNLANVIPASLSKYSKGNEII
ncbi:MAG TPA: MBG domain-containing protein [Patescibacteria group bacterium]|nr:MBG domain-containing protein [Patescibacteria group bacterium]